ncbi:MAG TPA: ABC transporter ATP-binding protein, partial [Roseiflexaceae bacterium]|nr:ABC transporter ATP-binding protein [Roseiflexaceae bacterium]
LMNILGGLDSPSSGKAIVAGHDLMKLSDRGRDRYRSRTVGFVWQQKARNLVPYLNIEQNIALPMVMSGVQRRARKAWTRELIDAVGLGARVDHRLAELSGGEQQRVAIAVALANRPKLLLADEPTGELDTATAAAIIDLFHALNRRYGLTIVIVSHDPNIAQHVPRVVTIHDGRTVSETRRRKVASGYEEILTLDGSGRFRLSNAVRERYGIAMHIAVEERPDGLFLRPISDMEAETQLEEPRVTVAQEQELFGRLKRALRRDSQP